MHDDSCLHTGHVAGMDNLEQRYRALVRRIRGYAMSEAARARILSEIEEIYRREKAAESGPAHRPPPAGPPGQGGT